MEQKQHVWNQILNVRCSQKCSQTLTLTHGDDSNITSSILNVSLCVNMRALLFIARWGCDNTEDDQALSSRSEIMTFCDVQLMFQLMAHSCSVMNQTVQVLAVLSPRAHFAKRSSSDSGEANGGGTNLFLSLYCIFLSSLWLVPSSPRSSGLFRPAPERVCNRRTRHLSYYFYFTTNGRRGGGSFMILVHNPFSTVPYLLYVCDDCSGFNCESFVLQQVAERTLHILSLVPLAPFSGLFMSIFFFTRWQTIGLLCLVHKKISGSSVILTIGYFAAWLIYFIWPW